MSRAPARSRRTALLVGLAVGLVVVLVLCRHNSYLFSLPIREDGDPAANSILVDRAVHLRLLVGNYSRVGFHHPGPAYLYVQAAGQAIFFAWLHLTPAAYNGQLLAVLVMNAAALGTVASIAYRHTRSIVTSVAFVGAVMLATGPEMLWASSWMPLMYVPMTLLSLVAGASVATGTLASLPALVVGVGFLVHGHVSFVALAGIGVLVVAGCWYLSSRGHVREATSRDRRALVISGVLALVFLAPLMIEVVRHFPGPWGDYLHYFRTGGHGHPVSAALSYAVSFWARSRRGRVLIAAVWLAALTLGLLDRDRDRRRFTLSVLGGTLVGSVLLVYYAARGVDDLAYRYVGFWALVLPALAVGALAVQLIGRLADRPRPWQVAAAVLVAAGSVLALTRPNLAGNYFGNPRLVPMSAALADHPERRGRVVAMDFDIPVWPTVAGLIQQAHRTGLPVCVVNPFFALIVMPWNVCSADQAANGVHLQVTHTSPTGTAAGDVWYRDEDVTFTRTG